MVFSQLSHRWEMCLSQSARDAQLKLKTVLNLKALQRGPQSWIRPSLSRSQRRNCVHCTCRTSVLDPCCLLASIRISHLCIAISTNICFCQAEASWCMSILRCLLVLRCGEWWCEWWSQVCPHQQASPITGFVIWKFGFMFYNISQRSGGSQDDLKMVVGGTSTLLGVGQKVC